MNSPKKKKAYTLAELLVTLSIVGIIATMTIPPVAQNIQEAHYRAMWKETYSTLSQATGKIMADNGGTMKGYCSAYTENTGEWEDCFKNLYRDKLNSIKDCNEGDSPGVCWHTGDGGGAKYLNGTDVGWWGNRPGLVLNNGVMLLFWFQKPDCSKIASWDGLPTAFACGFITVDINGFKGPNIVSKDLFQIYVAPNGLEPDGALEYWGKGSCKSDDTGWGCSADYLRQ